MITANKNKFVFKNTFQGNWAFVPTGLSAIIGIMIGLLIGSCLGWL